jgi:hypothetical protein
MTLSAMFRIDLDMMQADTMIGNRGNVISPVMFGIADVEFTIRFL